MVARDRSLLRAKRWALRLLDAMLRVGRRADAPKKLVRTYDLDGPKGWRIVDKATGRVIEGESAVRDFLDARFEDLPRPRVPRPLRA